MSEQNPKFQQITSTGKELFWKFGVKRVSVEEICEEAGVSKVTFYKHFKNKTELVKYLLEKMFNEAVMKYRDIMDSDIPFVEKVEKTIRMKLDNVAQYSSELLNDLTKGSIPELTKFIADFSKENLKMIRTDYTKAQQEGHIRQDIKIEFMMLFLNKLVELAGDEDYCSLYDSPHEMIREFTNFFFYGVVAREK